MNNASDGLSSWYYEVIRDEEKMEELKEIVFKVLDTIYKDKLKSNEKHSIERYNEKGIMDIADIDHIFSGEVSLFIAEWKEENLNK